MARRSEELHSDKEILKMYEYWAARAEAREREYLELEARLDNIRKALNEAVENFKYAESEIKRRRLR